MTPQVNNVSFHKFKNITESEQEKHLQAMYSKIVEVGTQKMEATEPHLETLKAKLAEIEQKGFEISPYEFHPILHEKIILMRIAVEFHIKAFQRILKWSKRPTASAYDKKIFDDKRPRFKIFQLATDLLTYFGTAFTHMDGIEEIPLECAAVCEKTKTDISPEEPEGKLSNDGVKQSIIDYLNSASRCVMTAMTEQGESRRYIKCLYSDIALYRTCPLSCWESAELDRIKIESIAMKAANDKQYQFLMETQCISLSGHQGLESREKAQYGEAKRPERPKLGTPIDAMLQRAL